MYRILVPLTLLFLLAAAPIAAAPQVHVGDDDSPGELLVQQQSMGDDDSPGETLVQQQSMGDDDAPGELLVQQQSVNTGDDDSPGETIIWVIAIFRRAAGIG